MKVVELKPIKESSEDFDAIEKAIIVLFKTEIYLPLIKALGLSKKTLQNSMNDLLDAIVTGRIEFYRGAFTGRFNSSTSKELKRLGAQWDRKQGSWKIPLSSLPIDVRNTISLSASRFEQKLASIDRKLSQILPAEVADKLKIEKMFDQTLFKTDNEFRQSVKQISVAPALSSEQRKKISEEWTTNMKLWIKDWTEKEIVKLRKDVQARVFTGNRYEGIAKTIEKSFDVSQNKARFLARQETSLLMTKFKETRYTDIGINEYRWGCVAGSSNHPVRPIHKSLEGKVFSWNNPPIVDDKGNRKNPGEDYNCRCFARPIVRF